MKLPTPLAQAIEQQVEPFSPRELARAVEELSLRYRGTNQGSRPLTSELERAAYLLTRLPATFAACSAVLRELRSRAQGLSIASMLDLGAGPGTAAWAAAEIFPELQRVELIERDAGMIVLGNELAQAGAPALQQATWHSVDATEHVGHDGFDLVVFAYSLGEVANRNLAALLERAWKQVRIALVIIEPGTPRGYELVLAAREQLIEAQASLLAPCPHERRCPMAGAKDWCHFAQRLERSAAHRRLKAGRLGYEDEKFSYVIFTRTQAARAGARVVRHPIHSKGHIKLELCAHDGLEQITASRSQGEIFRRARKAEWGDEWE